MTTISIIGNIFTNNTCLLLFSFMSLQTCLCRTTVFFILHFYRAIPASDWTLNFGPSGKYSNALSSPPLLGDHVLYSLSICCRSKRSVLCSRKVNIKFQHKPLYRAEKIFKAAYLSRGPLKCRVCRDVSCAPVSRFSIWRGLIEGTEKDVNVNA